METTGVKNFKYSVVTFIFGDYENVHEILEKDDDVEYLLITDNKNLKSDTWTIVYDEDLDGKGVFDKCFSVRYNLFKYCHSDICVRIDGSVKIKKSLTPIVDAFIESGADACFEVHPYRDNIITEYHAWHIGRDLSIDTVKKHIGLYKSLGFDINRKGMIQLNFSINKRSKITDDIDRIMYAFMKYLGDEKDIDRLDQTVISVVLDKFFPDIKIFAVGEDLLHSQYLSWNYHGKDKEIPFYPEQCCTPYLRNKEIEINSF